MRPKRLPVSDRCAVCGRVESLSHAFCQCSFEPTVWTWVFSIVNKFYSVPISFSPTLVLFRHGLPSGAQHARSNTLVIFLFNLTLNELWSARNLSTFEGKASSAHAVICKIKHRVRERIRAAYNFNFIRDFSLTWGHKRVLCTIEDKALRLLIAEQRAPEARARSPMGKRN